MIASKKFARILASLAAALGLFFLSPAAMAQTTAPKVVFQTSMGSFTVETDPEHAPMTVANFLRYVREGFYDGMIFHRIVPGFVIQGGGYDSTGRRRQTHEPIGLETKTAVSNARGTLSMARTNDPGSATTQFFVNLEDNPELNPSPFDPGNMTGYTVFGRVIEGMAVIEAIAMSPLGGNLGPIPQAEPRTPVVIQRATIAN
jgi:cyclophilin family peptidyl-prolyl cis-trans isomerase